MRKPFVEERETGQQKTLVFLGKLKERIGGEG
jgi:hypothetical protein